MLRQNMADATLSNQTVVKLVIGDIGK